MGEEKILILGGYGNTGIKVADLLLSRPDVEIILAARNRDRLKRACRQLSAKYPEGVISWIPADASDKASLLRAIEGRDLVVVASGTAEYAATVASAALEAGIDYLDVQYSTQKIEVLQSMEDQIRESGHCFITDAGFHPGLPAAMIRYGAQHFDVLETAVVGSAIRQDWTNLELAPSTQREFVQEIMDAQTLFFKDGEWKKGSMWTTKDFLNIDFGDEFGVRQCVPMFFEELRPLPNEFPSLKHMGFYIAGFNWVVDFLVFPFIMGLLKLFPHKGVNPMARLMAWSLGLTSRPPFGCVLKLEATGQKNDEEKRLEVILFHQDGYWFTAIPVVACLTQYFDGSIRKPGLWTMGNLVEPNRLMQDMKRMGVGVWEMEDG